MVQREPESHTKPTSDAEEDAMFVILQTTIVQQTTCFSNATEGMIYATYNVFLMQQTAWHLSNYAEDNLFFITNVADDISRIAADNLFPLISCLMQKTDVCVPMDTIELYIFKLFFICVVLLQALTQHSL